MNGRGFRFHFEPIVAEIPRESEAEIGFISAVCVPLLDVCFGFGPLRAVLPTPRKGGQVVGGRRLVAGLRRCPHPP